MKLTEYHDIISVGNFSISDNWNNAWEQVKEAILSIDWPHGSGKFTIYPVKQANGVKPIKLPCLQKLRTYGWETEKLPSSLAGVKMGNLDALLHTSQGSVGLEWETGNISSSHRAINKILLAMQHGGLSGGILVVPSKRLYTYLTDRVGNIDELKPYFALWETIKIANGIFRIVVVEHEAESLEVPPIPKGTDGRALV